MVTQEQRAELMKMLKRGDIARARVLYMINTGRLIAENSLEKFIKGDRPFSGARPGSHQPEEMFRAIAQAVSERHDREKRINTLAADILASTIEAANAAAIY